MSDLYLGTSQSASISGRDGFTSTESGKVKAPENFIKKPAAARAIWQRYRTEHLNRIRLYSAIEGLIAGNPPYDPDDLERAGLGHIANFNTLEGRSYYERSALAFWNLVNQAHTLCRMEIKKFPDQQGDVDLKDWANIMAENLSDIVREWPGFITQISTLSAQLVKFGISPIIWADERDWKWRTIEVQRFFVGDQALADIDQMTCMFVESSFTAQYLYEVYEEFKDNKDKDCPWNLKELEYLLVNRANTMAKPQTQIADMMDLQRSLQNGDAGIGEVFTDSLRLVTMLQKESDSKITPYMFDPIGDAGEFLYMADRQYNNIQEACVIFTASPGEFTLHSNRGVGHKIFAGCQAMNMMDCSIVDAARWAATPLIKSLDMGSKNISQIRFTPGSPTDIGSAEYVENNIGININPIVGASQYLNQKIQMNTLNSGDDPGLPDKDIGSKSGSQVNMESFKEFGVLKNNVANFYNGMDIVWTNMAAKILHAKDGWPAYEALKEWKERCEDDGIPPEIIKILFAVGRAAEGKLPRHLRVRASRVAGDGSNLARIMSLQAVGGVIGGASAKGQGRWRRDVVLAHCGRDYVDEYLEGADVPDENAGGASLAGVENAIMQLSQSPVFSQDNEHRGHIGTHFALLKHVIESVQKQEMTVVEADKIFSVAMPHTGQHIQAISQDPINAPFVKQIQGAWSQFSRYAELNKSKAEKEIQTELKRRKDLQEKQQAAQSEESIKQMQAEGDERRAEAKSNSQIQRADRANETRAEIMKKKVELDSDVDREKIHLDASNKRLEVQNKKEIDGKKQSQGEKDFADTSTEDLKQKIVDMNGSTPSPYDLEPNA